MDRSKNAFRVEAEIARAWTLPAHLYTDASILIAEKERLFARTWQVVGHGSQVKNPGDYFTTDLIGEPLVFVRGLDGKLRGFYNVCRHRAGPPAEGCGSRKLFRCGYHGWTYGLDGALSARPRSRTSRDFARRTLRWRWCKPRGGSTWCLPIWSRRHR